MIKLLLGLDLIRSDEFKKILFKPLRCCFVAVDCVVCCGSLDRNVMSAIVSIRECLSIVNNKRFPLLAHRYVTLLFHVSEQ